MSIYILSPHPGHDVCHRSFVPTPFVSVRVKRALIGRKLLSDRCRQVTGSCWRAENDRLVLIVRRVFPVVDLCGWAQETWSLNGSCRRRNTSAVLGKLVIYQACLSRPPQRGEALTSSL